MDDTLSRLCAPLESWGRRLSDHFVSPLGSWLSLFAGGMPAVFAVGFILLAAVAAAAAAAVVACSLLLVDDSRWQNAFCSEEALLKLKLKVIIYNNWIYFAS